MRTTENHRVPQSHQRLVALSRWSCSPRSVSVTARGELSIAQERAHAPLYLQHKLLSFSPRRQLKRSTLLFESLVCVFYRGVSPVSVNPRGGLAAADRDSLLRTFLFFAFASFCV
uniref:Transmembrane protein n=1 Tax=Knipowitschia caucasica TaxID=637954 RepID=A0AAV2LTG6_KNICA